METTIELINGEIVETTTTVQKHDPQTYLSNLEAEKNNIIAGRDSHLLEVNARIDTIQQKINSITELL